VVASLIDTSESKIASSHIQIASHMQSSHLLRAVLKDCNMELPGEKVEKFMEPKFVVWPSIKELEER